LIGIVRADHVLRDILGEVKGSGWVWGLLKIVEEKALFSAEFEIVFAMHPRQRRRVGVEGVGEFGVDAALVEKRSPG
jgi:hypothetical protein